MIPIPRSIEPREGTFDIRSPLTVSPLHGKKTAGSLIETSSMLIQFAENSWIRRAGVQIQPYKHFEDADVQLDVKRELTSEAYELLIERDRIKILASGESPAGWFYGLQTLGQLLWEAKTEGRDHLSCVKISDAPRFEWRGLHLDVCRHFFDVDFIKRLLELMAIHKLNRFHWHLTEDQGWRLDIPSLPRLAEISAWRDQNGSRYGGCYSSKDIGEVIDYAAARCIQVVPEIELPGHSVAALAAYPELACSPREFAVETNWGIFDDVYCAGNEATFTFLERVMDYVMDNFPGKVIHIGGDECPKTRWKECPKCQSRIKAEGLRDEEHLQSYFVQRMVNYLADRGRRAIGWDEILEGGLATGAMVMSWRGHEGGIAAAKMGHDVVMAPTSHCYFDYRQSDAPDEMGFHGVNTLRDVFDFQPVPDSMTDDEAKHVLGGQANVWTERQLFKPENVEYMIVPRICALAEVLWGQKAESQSWKGFCSRLTGHFDLLAQLGYRGRPLQPNELA